MKDCCKIVLIADCSGSMRKVYNDALGGMNTFVSEQKEVPGAATFELVTFSSKTTTKIAIPEIKLEDVPEITSEVYKADGLTALLEAIGITIERVGRELAALPEEERPRKVIIAIMTDGEENDSRSDYTYQSVAQMRTHQEEVYSWSFVMLANDLEDAEKLGITMTLSAEGYGSDAEATRGCYGQISETVKGLRS
jgi:uncharacterized protein YegL